jgi:hypothetical protein
MWLGGANNMPTAQVHNGLSRHASCYEVTADMASGHDCPNAVSTQSKASILWTRPAWNTSLGGV